MVIICITESGDRELIWLSSNSLWDAVVQLQYLKNCNPTKQFVLKALE